LHCVSKAGDRSSKQNSLMAEITAAHLVEHLQRCGFRLMKGPDAVAPTASHHSRADYREPDKP